MSIESKLAILADAAKYDASCASSGAKRKNNGKGIGHATGSGICHSYTPDGRCVSLLKILLTNYCIYDCKFCINRISSSTPRARFTPEEVVSLTMNFYRRNYIEDLFLSSGIIQNSDYTQEQINIVARKLREEENFGGYIHVKVIPGASDELLQEAGKYADRLSANIELPRQSDLAELITNAVKHFKFEKKGKRRIHMRPSGAEILACRPWLQAEITAVDPKVIVCLGASAAQSILGKKVTIQNCQSEIFYIAALQAKRKVLVTYHPSAILQMSDETTRGKNDLGR